MASLHPADAWCAGQGHRQPLFNGACLRCGHQVGRRRRRNRGDLLRLIGKAQRRSERAQARLDSPLAFLGPDYDTRGEEAAQAQAGEAFDAWAQEAPMGDLYRLLCGVVRGWA